MSEHKTGCLVCGRDLIYGKRGTRECYYCREIFDVNLTCECGHYVCDKCHSRSGYELIENFCISTQLEDPFEIALILMRSPKIKMHGPEHPFLVPAVLLAAYYNVKKDHKEKKLKIKEAKKKIFNHSRRILWILWELRSCRWNRHFHKPDHKFNAIIDKCVEIEQPDNSEKPPYHRKPWRSKMLQEKHVLGPKRGGEVREVKLRHSHER